MSVTDMLPKSERWTSKKWCDAAKGQECTMRLPGVCNGNTETTVFAHEGGAGMGMKADDFNGCDCCSACHDVLDGRVKSGWSSATIRNAFEQGRLETIKNRLERKVFK